MQSDPLIWRIIRKQFCSFRTVLRKETHEMFCRNEYNVNGICSQSSCPLANSSYATVREHDGKIYLYIKTVERAHSPKNLWEKIELHLSYTGALAQIDEHLMHWPAPQVHKIKQRLTRLHQMLIRMRRILKTPSKKLVSRQPSLFRREKSREAKALSAARLDFAIKKELLERLKNRTYGDLYNLNEKVFNDVLDTEGTNEIEFVEPSDADLDVDDIEDIDGDEVKEEDVEEEFEEEIEEEMEEEFEGTSLERSEARLRRDIAGLEKQLFERIKRKTEAKKSAPKKLDAKRRKGDPHIEIEYEQETESRTTTTSANW